jgi:Trk-type K+ transport system membrane component
MTRTRTIEIALIAITVAMMIAASVLHSYDNHDFDLLFFTAPPLMGAILGWLLRIDWKEKDAQRGRAKGTTQRAGKWGHD